MLNNETKRLMSTVIYPSPIFGPIHSRRLGISLGINLLPGDGKFCTFDCIYCECGYNKDHHPHLKLPTRQEVRAALEARLKDEYFPDAKVSVLSNSTFIHKPDVFQALCKVDNNILKLDTVDIDYINKVDRPSCHYSVDDIIEGMKSFHGKLIIQTMFMKGKTDDGEDVDNTSDKFVLPWIESVKQIAPSKVMIYTIDRETPDHSLQKATHEELDRIVSMLEKEGICAGASY